MQEVRAQDGQHNMYSKEEITSVQIAVAFQLEGGGNFFGGFAGPLSARERTPPTFPADAEAGI